MESEGLTVESVAGLYNDVARRTPNTEADAFAFENLTMSLHHLAGLGSMVREGPESYNVVRMTILSWYYAIYDSSQAMINAASGARSDTHSKTAKIWQTDIVRPGILPDPFGFSITNLTTGSIEQQNTDLRQGNTFDVNTEPIDRDQAYGAIISYLKGTADWEKWHTEQKIKASREFERLGVKNFRSQAAQALRDQQLSARSINFIHQAFRYRGKANYRDSIYLSYGNDNVARVSQFLLDLRAVAQIFVALACRYVSRRTIRGTWEQFANDLDENARFVLPLNLHDIQ